MNKKVYLLISLLIIISMMDRPSINIDNMNIRFGWLILPFIFTSMPVIYKKYPIKGFYIINLFLLAASPSFLVSYQIYKSIFYICWIYLNFFTFFTLFYRFTYAENEKALNLLLGVSRVVLILALLAFIVKLDARPSGIFYESSYLSIALIPYTVFVFFEGGYSSKIFDKGLIFSYLIFGQSAAFLIYFIPLILIMVFSPFFNSKLNKESGIKLVLSVFFVFLILYIYINFVNDLNTVFIKRLIDELSFDNIYYLMLRGGNRIPRLIEGWDVARENMFFGVGLGAYESYINTVGLNTIYEEFWLSTENQPPVNIWIEIFATTGFFNFMVSIIGTLYLLKKIIIYSGRYRNNFILIIISIIITLSFEANYLRGYIWLYIAFICGYINRWESNNFKIQS